MRPNHRIAVLAAAILSLAVIPPAAGASIRQELDAGGSVERIATRFYPRYDFVANCDQYTARRFWCTVSGRYGTCYRQGHATVKRTRDRRPGWWTNWVTLRGMNRSCF